jgi:hypothetical protein
MPSHSLMIGLGIAFLAVAGIVAAVIREIRLFSDFRDIAPQVKTIANLVRAEVFRDRQDLVLSGLYKGIPTVLRFSKQPGAPAMGLYVRVPATCQLSLIPKRSAGNANLQNVKTGSRMLEKHFVAMADNPADLDALLQHGRAPKLLETLCSSGKTILELNLGRLELLEMTLPEELTRYASEQLLTIREFSELLAELPGSDRVETRSLERAPRSWFFKLAIAAGIAVVAISVIAATRERAKVPVLAAAPAEMFHGIPTEDAELINGMDAWHAAKPDELNVQFSNWLEDAGKRPASRIEFNPVESGLSHGVAYLLVREDGARRLVVLVDQRAVFDACFARLDGIAVLPAASFPKLKWGQSQAPAQKPNGDAILVVRDASDPRSSEVLFFPNGTLFSGVPRDYSTIDLQKAN